ncbi:MAG: hypothetical protein ACXWWL_02325 [Candidatus Limnocylindria bacterium]
MARRGDREFSLSPRARRVAGWIAAIGLVGGIALGVRIVGGSGDGSPGAAESPSAPAGDVAPITFGTALDPATGLVATPARTSRFEESDLFVYSVADVLPPTTVYVEVERYGGGPAEIVQEQSVQTLAPESLAIAFSVPAAVLLDAFGSGEYRMRIYLAGEPVPVAEGSFVLVGSVATSPAPS